MDRSRREGVSDGTASPPRAGDRGTKPWDLSFSPPPIHCSNSELEASTHQTLGHTTFVSVSGRKEEVDGSTQAHNGSEKEGWEATRIQSWGSLGTEKGEGGWEEDLIRACTGGGGSRKRERIKAVGDGSLVADSGQNGGLGISTRKGLRRAGWPEPEAIAELMACCSF